MVTSPAWLIFDDRCGFSKTLLVTHKSYEPNTFFSLLGYEANFKKYNHGIVDRLEAPYDMTSLMHLPRNAFSKNGLNTLEARAGPNVPLGRRDRLSEIDKAQLNSLYSCTGYPS